MAWNVPTDKQPDNNKDKDPWTGKPKAPNSGSSEQGPPLLDELLKEFLKKIQNISNKSFKPSWKISQRARWWIAIALIVVGWILLGITHLEGSKIGLLFRFGSFQESLQGGWHWLPVGIENLKVFDQNKILTESITADVITQDANLAHLGVQVAYKIVNPQEYSLPYQNPAALLRTMTQMAVVKVSAHSNLDTLFADAQSSQFAKQVQETLDQLLGQKTLGVSIEKITVASIAVPENAKETFNKIDALYQEQGKQRMQADEYEKSNLPVAEAKVNQLIVDAKNYAAQATLNAQQEVRAFLAMLPSYNKEPELTRHRLYDDMMADVLSKTTKIVVDEKAPAASIVLPPSPRDASKENVVSTSSSIPSASASSNSANALGGELSSISNNSDNPYADAKGGYS